MPLTSFDRGPHVHRTLAVLVDPFAGNVTLNAGGIGQITAQPTADATVLGINGAQEGQEFSIVNDSAFLITLSHENAGVAEEARLCCAYGVDKVLPPKGTPTLIYSDSLARWVVTSPSDSFSTLASGSHALSAAVSIGATSVSVAAFPSAYDSLGWVLIDAFTSEAEFRKITTISGGVANFATALVYAHARSDVALFVTHTDLSAILFGAAAGTDSTTAIQRALNEVKGVGGSAADLPSGSFNTSATITIPDWCTLRGVGGRSGTVGGYNKTTQLKWVGATSATAVVVSMAGKSSGKLLSINLSGDAKAGIGLDVSGYNLVVYDCFFQYCAKKCIQSLAASGANGGVLIDYCFLQGDGEYGIYSDNYADGWITRNEIGAVFSIAGIALVGSGCDDVVISKNHVYVNLDGITLTSCRNIIVSNNQVHDNQRIGIWLYGSAWSNTIIGNTCNLNGTDAAHGADVRVGIYLSSASSTSFPKGNTVNGNTCGNDSDTQQYGVSIYGYAAKNNITGNTLYGNALGGVLVNLVAGQTDNTIANNQGYNPIGVLTAPAMPASATALTNPFCVACSVYVNGGTVTKIELGPGVGYNTGTIAGLVHLMPGQDITITYTVAPTWNWFGE